MNKKPNQDTASPEVEAAAADAVEQGEDIKASVREITMQALSKGRLDAEKIRGVVGSVVSGIAAGAKKEGANVSRSVRDALSGVDDALAKSALASRLAIEEVAGHAEEFGHSEFKRALDDLKTLEELFLQTIKEAASSSETRVRETLNDFLQHAKVSGTAVGKAAAENAETLSRTLGNTLLETATGGAEAALRVGSQLSQAAAGFLDGLASSVKERSQSQNK